MAGHQRKVNASDANMSQYDAQAWQDIQQWKQRRINGGNRYGLPEVWQQQLSRAGTLARQGLSALPGADRFEARLIEALRGLADFGARTASASVRKSKVVGAYQKGGHAVRELADIAHVDLADIDQVKPRLDVSYIAASTLQGATTGLVGTGVTAVATGAGVATAGAAAAPGAATIVGAMAVDAAAVMFASHRVVAHVAAYYGYDVESPHERLFALGVLGLGTAAPRAKAAAYIELNRLVQGLLRGHGVERLGGNGVARVVQQVYQLLGIRLTKRKLAQAVPLAGVVIGAGLNARMLARVADEANYLYRERFLREKYDLVVDVVAEPVTDDENVVSIVDIIDAEIVDE
jgi:hypothetical protein